MPRKGYYTEGDYFGFVNGTYQRFDSESEYNKYIDELEEEYERGADVL